METIKIKDIVNQILTDLVELSNFNKCLESLSELHPIHTYKLTTSVGLKEKITFVLPAFPAKSANRKKTLSNCPDLGEVESLKNLNNLASKINEYHRPGAEIVICSDGRVFSDLVGVTEEDVSIYRERLKKIVNEFNLTNITFFDLEDEYDSKLNFDQMRYHLDKQYSKTEEALRSEIKKDEKSKNLFNGIHRFLKEDFSEILKERSKNQINKVSKEKAYKVVLRSDAWSRLVEKRFPNAFRLSIHPQDTSSIKFPVKLLPCEEKWGTPWHRVPVVSKSGLQLMRHEDAIEAGAVLKSVNNYEFFELQGAV